MFALEDFSGILFGLCVCKNDDKAIKTNEKVQSR